MLDYLTFSMMKSVTLLASIAVFVGFWGSQRPMRGMSPDGSGDRVELGEDY